MPSIMLSVESSIVTGRKLITALLVQALRSGGVLAKTLCLGDTAFRRTAGCNCRDNIAIYMRVTELRAVDPVIT